MYRDSINPNSHIYIEELREQKPQIEPKPPKIKIQQKPSFDGVLFLIVVSLIGIGIIQTYSLSVYITSSYNYNSFHFFIRQLIVGGAGILIMWQLAKIDPDKLISKVGWLLFVIFSLILIFMPFLPNSILIKAGGATRWLNIGFMSLSPVEFFKIGFIYFISNSFYRRLNFQEKLKFKDEVKLLMPYVLVFGVVVFLIAVVQKDLGQIILLSSILGAMLFFANRSYKVFLALIGVFLVAFLVLIILFPHRVKRVLGWWSHVQDSLLSFMPSFVQNALRVDQVGLSYQISNSLNAVTNGGFLGQNIAQGSYKLGFLPEVHTDFVLAGLSEENGFLGFFIVCSLIFFMIIRILRISRRVINSKYHLFTLGLGIMLATEFLINAFGVSGILPIKGMGVPFLSYGGSSLLASCVAIGLILSISRSLYKDAPKDKPQEEHQTNDNENK